MITNTNQGDARAAAQDARAEVSPLRLPFDKPVPLHPLTYLEENGEVVVGRPDIDSYGVFPPDGVALLQQLAAGVPPAEAARWYAGTYGEQVDLADFLDTLNELHLVGEPPPADRPAVRWQRLGRWTFSPAAWACYVLLIAAASGMMIARPRLAPHPGNVFFTHHLTVLELVLSLGQVPLVLLHECFHILAGRRLGLRSSLRLSRRLYYLVLETRLDGLVALPRRQRYLPMLAGSLADLVVASVLTLIAAATMRPDGTVPVVGAICLAQAYETLLRVAWQFFVYLRTDLYCVTVTVFGCLDLHAAAQRILANRFRRLLHWPPADESLLHPRDRAVGRWYSWLVLAGYPFSLIVLGTGVVPVVWRLLATALGRFTHGGQSWWQIADSAGFLVLNITPFAIALGWGLRSFLRRRRQSHPSSARQRSGG